MAANIDKLHPELRARVLAMIAASGGRITIRSGYRSPEHQARIVEEVKKKRGAEWRKWAAPPGKSNHNHGEAVDLGGDLKLARRLAPQFSLVFPMDHEPWHAQRAEFKSKKSSLTVPPASTYGQLQRRHTAATAPTPALATLTTPTTTTANPVPTQDRKDIGVQLTSLLSILDKPIDFDGEANGTAA